MSRHKTDHRAQSDGGRLRNFYRIEKSGGGQEDTNHAASLALHQRPATRTAAARVENFVRIERGITA